MSAIFRIEFTNGSHENMHGSTNEIGNGLT